MKLKVIRIIRLDGEKWKRILKKSAVASPTIFSLVVKAYQAVCISRVSSLVVKAQQVASSDSMYAARSFFGLLIFVLMGYAVMSLEGNGRNISDNFFSSCTAGSSSEGPRP